MPLSGEFFLIWRYLRPRWALTSVLNWLSTLGPTLGVGVLLVVISIMNGFPTEVQTKIVEFDSHLSIVPRAGCIDDYMKLNQYMSKTYRTQGSPYTSLPIFIQKAGTDEVKPFMAKGIDTAMEQKVGGLSRHMLQMKDGIYRLRPGEIYIPVKLASEMGLAIGSKLIIHSPEKYGRLMLRKDASQPQSVDIDFAKEVTVAGIFDFGYVVVDGFYTFMNIDDANSLCDLEWGSSQGLDLLTPFPKEEVEDFARHLIQDETLYRTNHSISLVPWNFKPQAREFLDLVKKEKTMMMLVLFFIVAGAAVAVAATLFSLVLQKTREIGLLKALGVSPLSIIFVFLTQGAILGVLGSTLGMIGGYVTLLYRQEIVHKIGYWNPDFQLLSNVPMAILPMDCFIIYFGSIVICCVASLFPALVAVSVNPVKALNAND